MIHDQLREAYQRCKKCNTPLISLNPAGHSEGRDIYAERIGMCRECLSGEKKRCHCGKFYLSDQKVPQYECLECYLSNKTK